MTENERKEMLKDIRDGYIDAWDNIAIDELFEQIEKEHIEIQQYRAIGAIEELQALKEKNVAKKPYIQQSERGDCFECPNCDSFIGYVVDCQDEHYQDNYCPYCSQKLDWQ